jgi:hypothetical protein
MNAPATFSNRSYGSYAHPDPLEKKDSLRIAAYVLIAIIAFVTGMLVGNSRAPAKGGSRIEWPSSESLRPHPRSLQH